MATSPTRNEKEVGCAIAGTVPIKPAVLSTPAASRILKEVFMVYPFQTGHALRSLAASQGQKPFRLTNVHPCRLFRAPPQPAGWMGESHSPGMNDPQTS